MRRRTLLTGLVLAPVVGRAAVAVADRLIHTIRAQLDAAPPGPVLLASFPDRAANAAFPKFAPVNDPAAYTYDNALAGLALLAGGYGLHAARIADALAMAQVHDPNYNDGRLRNAYRAGPTTLPIALPGWWDARSNQWAEDPYQVGSETGPIAWAILLWTALRDAGINSERYEAAAMRAAGWIIAHCRADKGFSGGVFGFPPYPRKLRWVSTEQNTDCAVAFGRLHLHDATAHAATFVHAMHDAHSRLFAAGLTPDGARNGLIAADANLWPYLAGLANAAVLTPALAALGWPRGHPNGIGFSAASQGIWIEGTSFAVLALRRAGQATQSRHFFTTASKAITPDGMVMTTMSTTLATGLTVGPGAGSAAFTYYRVPALAPTAWAALAGLGANPLQP